MRLPCFFCSVFAYIRFFLGHETPFWEKFAKNRRLIDYRNRGRKKGGCAVKANYDTPPLAYRKTDCNFPSETRKTKAFESVFDNLLIMAVKKTLKTANFSTTLPKAENKPRSKNNILIFKTFKK